MRKIEYIIIHCSATVEGKAFDVNDIDAWHKKRGWKGVGYHYVIKLDGTIEKGRPDSNIGAHVKGFNRKSLGICYIGGLDKNLAPKDTRTELQKTAIYNLLCKLKDEHPQAEIKGHREFSPDLNGNGILEPFEFSKACPSFSASLEYKDLCD